MKIATAIVAAVLFTGTFGALNNAVAADNDVMLQQELTPASYCHMKFAALEEATVPDDDANVIDFYGTCNETPRGQAQVQDQKLDYGWQWTNNFSD